MTLGAIQQAEQKIHQLGLETQLIPEKKSARATILHAYSLRLSEKDFLPTLASCVEVASY